MCEVTREIERKPQTQRDLLEIRRMAEEIAKYLRELLDKGGPDGAVGGHA